MIFSRDGRLVLGLRTIRRVPFTDRNPSLPQYFVMALLASTYSEWLSLVTQFSNRIGTGCHPTPAQVHPKQSITKFTAITRFPRPRPFGSISIRLRSRVFS